MRDRAHCLWGHVLEGADVALLCKASAWKGVRYGESNRASKSPILLYLCKGVPGCSTQTPWLSAAPPASCLCFHCRINLKKKRKEKQKRGWDTERKTKIIKAGFGHWRGAAVGGGY